MMLICQISCQAPVRPTRSRRPRRSPITHAFRRAAGIASELCGSFSSGQLAATSLPPLARRALALAVHARARALPRSPGLSDAMLILGDEERGAAISEVSRSGCSTKCRWQYPPVGIVPLTETVAGVANDVSMSLPLHFIEPDVICIRALHLFFTLLSSNSFRSLSIGVNS
jgi:hypothetical protein